MSASFLGAWISVGIGAFAGLAFTLGYTLLAPMMFARLPRRVARIAVLELAPIFVFFGGLIGLSASAGFAVPTGLVLLVWSVGLIVVVLAIYWLMGQVPAVGRNRAAMASEYPEMDTSLFSKLTGQGSARARSERQKK
ncbi:MAG: hypothetical protein V7672_06165 [Brevundimonas sp.]|uniref:hypothetical protein n=1 Tax=Brevundimonas sp. TaxID=1871086 RepID=UPI00300321B9